MKIAIPLTEQNTFSAHYGGATQIAIFEYTPGAEPRLSQRIVTPPTGEPCSWPNWLHEEGLNVLLAGGIGGNPRQRFTNLGILVVVGVESDSPSALAEGYIHNTLKLGANGCGATVHGHEHTGHHRHSGNCNCSD